MKFNSSTIPFRFQNQQKSSPINNSPRPIGLPAHQPSTPPPQSRQQQQLNQALDERRRLRAMENSAPDPINMTAQHRGRLVEHRIDQLRQELAEKNSSSQ